MSHPARSLLLAALAAPLALAAQTTDAASFENHIEFGGGNTTVFGDTARYQQMSGHKRATTGGIEDFHYVAIQDDLTATIDARALFGDQDFLISARLDKGELLHFGLGAEQFRTYYDGSGGVFAGQPASLIDTSDLYVDRGRFWFEVGITPDEGVDATVRYEHQLREGTKSSTHWGTPTGGTRKIAPATNDIDETRDIVTLDLGKITEELTWKVGASAEHNELNNTRESVSGGSYSTTKDGTIADLFSSHGQVTKPLGEKVTVSAGALVTTIDTNLEGSRVNGATPFGATTNNYLTLDGGANVKEYVGNFNLAWNPDKNWTVTPSFRFSDEQTEADAILTGGTVGTHVSSLEWIEVTEAVEARYRGFKDWSLSLEGELLQGEGDRFVDAIGTNRDRIADQARIGQKYTASAHWYFKPGLSFTGQYYFQQTANDNDFHPIALGNDNYFHDFQRFRTHDVNIRANWRPFANLGLVTRYDYKITTIHNRIEGLPEIEGSTNTGHVISQSATWTPIARLYLVGNISFAFNTLETAISSTSPLTNYYTDSDNDYITASLGAGYALCDKSDIFVDYTHYSGDNLIDNSAVGLPYGLDEQYNVVGLTYTLRPTARIAYTLRYAYANYDEDATLGTNDFEAHTVYGKVQYRF